MTRGTTDAAPTLFYSLLGEIRRHNEHMPGSTLSTVYPFNEAARHQCRWLSMRFGLVAKNDRVRPLDAAGKVCLCLAKTVCHEILVCPPAGKMVARVPTNLESI